MKLYEIQTILPLKWLEKRCSGPFWPAKRVSALLPRFDFNGDGTLNAEETNCMVKSLSARTFGPHL